MAKKRGLLREVTCHAWRETGFFGKGTCHSLRETCLVLQKVCHLPQVTGLPALRLWESALGLAIATQDRHSVSWKQEAGVLVTVFVEFFSPDFLQRAAN